MGYHSLKAYAGCAALYIRSPLQLLKGTQSSHGEHAVPENLPP
jgi:hypothetical protein